jgi:hypothetical protein
MNLFSSNKVKEGITVVGGFCEKNHPHLQKKEI